MPPSSPPSTAGAPEPPRPAPRRLAVITAVTGLLSIGSVIALGLTGRPEAVTAAGMIGGAAFAAGGITVTVNIRR
ncbi:hypothetical protein ABZT27_31905 [Streptomyces sp. NPDC005389]|uniref:hypothetical protein n=1 Tax=Streptomyces sp. NPDC005389 TaxID=3157040 RepID=UPI00339E64F2